MCWAELWKSKFDGLLNENIVDVWEIYYMIVTQVAVYNSILSRHVGKRNGKFSQNG